MRIINSVGYWTRQERRLVQALRATTSSDHTNLIFLEAFPRRGTDAWSFLIEVLYIEIAMELRINSMGII